MVALPIVLSIQHIQAAEPAPRLSISWEKNFLTIHGEHLPGKDVSIALPQERRPASWIMGSMKV